MTTLMSIWTYLWSYLPQPKILVCFRLGTDIERLSKTFEERGYHTGKWLVYSRVDSPVIPFHWNVMTTFDEIASNESFVTDYSLPTSRLIITQNIWTTNHVFFVKPHQLSLFPRNDCLVVYANVSKHERRLYLKEQFIRHDVSMDDHIECDDVTFKNFADYDVEVTSYEGIFEVISEYYNAY